MLRARFRIIGGGVAPDRSSSTILLRWIHEGIPMPADLGADVPAGNVGSGALGGALSVQLADPIDLRKNLFRPRLRLCCPVMGG